MSRDIGFRDNTQDIETSNMGVCAIPQHLPGWNAHTLLAIYILYFSNLLKHFKYVKALPILSVFEKDADLDLGDVSTSLPHIQVSELSKWGFLKRLHLDPGYSQ